METPSTKSQISNKKAIKLQIYHQRVWIFGLSNLDIVWNLDIGIWDFRSLMVVLNCFDLAGLSSTLTYLWFFPRTTPSFFHRQYLPLGERCSRKPPQ